MINIYWMILVRTYIEGLPKELFEAASSEGAGEFTIFLKGGASSQYAGAGDHPAVFRYLPTGTPGMIPIFIPISLS